MTSKPNLIRNKFEQKTIQYGASLLDRSGEDTIFKIKFLVFAICIYEANTFLFNTKCYEHFMIVEVGGKLQET